MLYARNGSAVNPNTTSLVTSGTSTYTYTSEGYQYSPIYSSTATTARIWEQIFTQEPDPMPHTPDWTNEITSFNTQDWQYFRVSASGHRDKTASGMGGLANPIIRAYNTLPDNSYSATLPVDGVSYSGGFRWDYSAGSMHSGNSSQVFSGKYPTGANEWAPISEIIGTDTGTLHACIATYAYSFGGLDGTVPVDTGNPAWIKLPEGCGLSGAIQFANKVEGTAESTGYNTALVPVYVPTKVAQRWEPIDYVVLNFTLKLGSDMLPLIGLKNIEYDGQPFTSIEGESDDGYGQHYIYNPSSFTASLVQLKGSGWLRMSADRLHAVIDCLTDNSYMSYEQFNYTSQAYRNGVLCNTMVSSVQYVRDNQKINLYK